ncbi:4-hydroxy-tetrahydrodipicolinate synthase [Bacillaceae bacterium SIJ1]|uniref:4-hydroxy-tetrahydrodipicolinate synthase n=1 Tax=Litoribacterium kuwaitense TaxID=1398745 RepID=UPI0013ECD76C|nr:4-hydroxy-tetrahydrodipicolinate synthase [Litoribacterium kuwaitense]NGP44076.1 4-hydroxy-tetrahydrodipicolinate synthase [Litoribacterium kuwaitense]
MDVGHLLTAMATPFDGKGNVDFQKISQLIDWLIRKKTSALVVTGTTGESPTLTKEEKVALWTHVVKETGGRIPVIAGVGTNNTRETIEMAKKAEQSGVDGLMCVVPYYNKPNEEGVLQHISAVTNAVQLPMMLYHIPGRTGVKLSVDGLAAICSLPNVFAVKESSGDLAQVSELISRVPGVNVYSGDDDLALPMAAVGAKGVVSVASHIVGEELDHMLTAFQRGNTVEAARIHRMLSPLMKALFIAPNPVPVKTALQLCGLDVGSVRLPLTPLTNDERELLQTILGKK